MQTNRAVLSWCYSINRIGLLDRRHADTQKSIINDRKHLTLVLNCDGISYKKYSRSAILDGSRWRGDLIKDTRNSGKGWSHSTRNRVIGLNTPAVPLRDCWICYRGWEVGGHLWTFAGNQHQPEPIEASVHDIPEHENLDLQNQSINPNCRVSLPRWHSTSFFRNYMHLTFSRASYFRPAIWP